MNTYGWKKVFKFTFVQNAKSKSFIISSILICTLVFGMIVLVGLLPTLFGGDDSSGNGGEGGSSTTDIKASKVYFIDNSGITKADDYAKFFTEKNITFEVSTESFDALSEKVENESGSMMIAILSSENGYQIYSGVCSDGSVSKDTGYYFNDEIYNAFNKNRLTALGLSSDDADKALLPISTQVSILGITEENTGVLAIKTIVPMISSLILFILIFAYGQLVAQSIAQEKTSRVMELLLTSVKPLAVIIGKILAMGVLSLLQFIMFIAAGFLGGAVAAPMLLGNALNDMGGLEGITGAVQEGMTQVGTEGNEIGMEIISALSEGLSGFNPLNIIYIFIIFLVGFVFYALVAGLIGASVSRIEDLNSAMQPYSILGVVGFYLAYFPNAFAVTGETNPMAVFANYFPLSSPFALPSALLTGQMGAVEALIALLVLIVCTVLFAILVAKVYEQVILHTGNKLKITDILGLARKK